MIAAAVVPFLPALRGGFSDFDDHGFLLEVDGWRGLAPSNLAWMFTTIRLGHYQPLTYLSYAIDYTLFGLDPRAFHAGNIGLHALCALLLWLLIRRILGLAAERKARPALSGPARTVVAGLVAALWAAHPLRVESVAWITERRDVLSCLLMLGATLAYLRHATSRSASRAARHGRWYWIALVLLLLSLLAKAWGMTFFLVALLIDIRPLRRLTLRPREWWSDRVQRDVLAEKLPMLGLGVLAAGIAALAQSDKAARSLDEWGVIARLAQSAYGLCFYIERTIAPRDLSLLYELPTTFEPMQARWIVPIGIVVAASVLIGLRLRRSAAAVRTGQPTSGQPVAEAGLDAWPSIAVGLGCYATLVAPVLGMLQSGAQLVADRYAHIPTIPLFVLLACAAGSLSTRRTRSVYAPIAALFLTVASLVTLGSLTWKRSELWTSDALLWQDSIRRGIDGPRLRNMLANHLEGQGRLTEAEEHYRRSVALDPRLSDSWFGLGTALSKQKRFPEAIEALRQAALTATNPAPALMMVGVISISHLGRSDHAIDAFRAAIDVTERLGNPERTGRPYLLLAAALGQSGDEAGALPLLRKAAGFADTRAEAEGHLRALGAIK